MDVAIATISKGHDEKLKHFVPLIIAHVFYFPEMRTLRR